MDAYSFPAAIVSSWIIVAAIGYGSKLAREENSTGIEPKAATPFIFGCLGLFWALWMVEDRHSFIYNVTSDMLGALIGLGSAYFGLRFVAALRQARSQRRGPRP